MDALWIINTKYFFIFWYKIDKKSQRKLPNFFDGFHFCPFYLPKNARNSVLILKYGQKWTRRIPTMNSKHFLLNCNPFLDTIGPSSQFSLPLYLFSLALNLSMKLDAFKNFFGEGKLLKLGRCLCIYLFFVNFSFLVL